ncbi:N,N-dimethylformamidase beta subunit family domain-containing protein [Marmoricola sp. URHB0036]|uniref:N,N-dimethylformamidase beta subunit family domain-containing protein n=1 Tax=Marmoricola sp. URHB0036 TaxID=1298863 RepID=UPI000686A46C|nr:N,N-dimethylformamidase beta subunit family domain-containing protein [Marmoricola sp. URHB0036]
MSSPTNTNQKVYGYTDRLSARPGEQLTLHVSCEAADSYAASVVQLHHGFDGSAGPGFQETVLTTRVDGTYPGQHYECRPGSFVEVNDPDRVLTDPVGFEVRAAIFPTLPRDDRSGTLGAYRISHSSVAFHGEHQTVLGTWDAATSTGWALTLEDGRPTFVWSESGRSRTVQLDTALTAHHWYELLLQVPAGDGEVTLTCNPLKHAMDLVAPAAARLTPESAGVRTEGRLKASDMPFRIGALAARSDSRLVATSAFNGKIGGVQIQKRVSDGLESVARWHFGRSERPDGLLLSEVVDDSPNGLDGRCVNGPVRGVTGPTFQGLVEDFRVAPDEYDAIHFHDDDIADADWPVALTFDVPEDLASGVYAFRLTADGRDHHVPFFVGPGQRARDVAVLFPTGTYLAYANDRIAFEADSMEMLLGHTPIVHSGDLDLQDHPEFGRSCYEIHNDGSGVIFSTARRPLITMQPRYRASFMSEGPWGLPADLCIAHWLDEAGCEFDALTDETLDIEGYDLISRYRVIITGSHPEYMTRAELDALAEFTAAGGRLMYLGGNGFYATTSYDPENRHVVEVRRADGGTRPHQSPFAERRHTTSGESAGLWRNKGKAPERLVGVGMSAQGFDRCTHYQRLEDSFDARAAFIFEGIGATELLGDFGIIGGGAAGSEIDLYNPSLGTPPDTLVLATSGPLSDNYLLVAEELYEQLPGLGGTEQPSVRSDVVYAALDGGGGFFSVGSIAWTGSLSHNEYENNIARLTTNVLRRFRDAEPLK